MDRERESARASSTGLDPLHLVEITVDHTGRPISIRVRPGWAGSGETVAPAVMAAYRAAELSRATAQTQALQRNGRRHRPAVAVHPGPPDPADSLEAVQRSLSYLTTEVLHLARTAPAPPAAAGVVTGLDRTGSVALELRGPALTGCRIDARPRSSAQMGTALSEALHDATTRLDARGRPPDVASPADHVYADAVALLTRLAPATGGAHATAGPLHDHRRH